MTISNLIIVDDGRSAHHEVGTGAILWEGNDFANVFDVLENHEEAIDTVGATCVWWSTKLESVEHATEALFDIFLVVTENAENFVHDFGIVIPDGAGGRFDYIVLDLNEAVAGIWDILRQCKKVYTCLPEEEAAASKYRHYEYLLKELEAEDILAKTAIIKITQTAGSDPNADYERNEIIRRLGEEFR